MMICFLAVACGDAAPPRTPRSVAPPDDATAWVDLQTMSVNLRDKRVRALQQAIVSEEPRLEITHHPSGATTVRDVETNATMTFRDGVRWAGGYAWSSGDLILSTEKRLVRIELTSTDPKYVGSVIWQKPPLAGSRTAALLLGKVDASPNEADKRIAFAGYEPSGDAPIEVAVIEALGRDSFRATLAIHRSCSKREVRILSWSAPEIAVVVACPEGADIERVRFDGQQ